MELMAMVELKGVQTFQSIGSRSSVATISRKNLIAFSAPRCFKMKKGSENSKQQTEKVRLSDCDFGGVADTVFVCPLASPWNVHFVVHMDSEIKHIVWDPSGTRLLTADASGQIFLWQMQECLVNKWLYTNFTRSFYGDDVIALKWINTTQLFTVAKDVREQSLYEKKFPLSSVTPAAGHFGGRSVDVWVAVTSSGAVGIGLVQQKTEMVVKRTTLESFEGHRLMCADIVIDPAGSIHILTTSGKTKDPIRLHKLQTEIQSNTYFIQNTNCLLSCECFSCFFVDKCTENDRISSVRYVQPLSGQVVLVCIDKPHGTEIQQWTMCEETLGLHTAFHANTIIPEKNFHWIRQTSHQLQGYVTASAVNPLITDNTNMFPFGSAFCSGDNKLHLASRLSLSDMQCVSSTIRHNSEHISSVAVSPHGCICVAITSDCNMLIYAANNQTIEHLTILLEYSMFTGTTCEDIIMCLKPEQRLGEKIMQSIEMNLNGQNCGTQSQYKTKLQALKVTLSMASENNMMATDYLTAILLNHIKSSFMSALSTCAYEESDQNAEDKLNGVLDVSSIHCDELDIDKIGEMLEPSSDFLPDDGAVAHLQPLVQWTCDLTMTLLSSLPVYNFGVSSGLWLVKDLKSLATLKQLLVLIRLWSAAVHGIRPVLSCSMSFDVIAKLYKLLTMLAASIRDSISLSDGLIEDCSLLSNQVVLPPFEKSFCWSEFPYTLSLGASETATHCFGEVPASISCMKVPFGQYIANGLKDIFSQLAVSGGDEYKRCIRCLAVTALTRPITDQKSRNTMPHYCVCGGMWQLSSLV